ncbi:MAG: SDR family oxidoreductase [Anaerolineae bacterium]
MSETYLVTGGAGFIGSHIVEALVEAGETVRVIDNFATGRPENLAPFRDRITFYELDITDRAALDEAFDGVDYVLHQAAIPSVPRSVDDPLGTHDANVTGTLNVLDAARKAGVRRVVYAASSSAYGEIAGEYKREDMNPSPLSPYAAAKLAGEHYCQAFFHVYGLETVALRYFNVFGPRQDPTSQYAAVIPLFVTAMLDGRPPTVYGDGLQSRDFTYVANVVRGNLLACKAPAAAAGQVINMACGDSISLLDLIAEINAILGTDIAPVHTAPRPGDIKHSKADITRARELLGYEPQVSFREGLARTVAFFRALS